MRPLSGTTVPHRSRHCAWIAGVFAAGGAALEAAVVVEGVQPCSKQTAAPYSRLGETQDEPSLLGYQLPQMY